MRLLMTLQKTPGGIWSDEEMLEDDEEASLHIEDSPVASSSATETSTKSLSSIILGQSQPGQKFYGISAEDRELRIALKVSMLLTCVCLLLAPNYFLFCRGREWHRSRSRRRQHCKKTFADRFAGYCVFDRQLQRISGAGIVVNRSDILYADRQAGCFPIDGPGSLCFAVTVIKNNFPNLTAVFRNTLLASRSTSRRKTSLRKWTMPRRFKPWTLQWDSWKNSSMRRGTVARSDSSLLTHEVFSSQVPIEELECSIQVRPIDNVYVDKLVAAMRLGRFRQEDLVLFAYERQTDRHEEP